MTTEWLTVPEVALALKCDEETVRVELRRGNLRGSKLTIGWRVSREDLADYITDKANVA